MHSVRRAVNETIGEISENPFGFHSEADCHAILYNHLRSEFPELYETAFGQRTTLVHCEYFGRRPDERIDLVVLSPQDVRNIDVHFLAKRTPRPPGYEPASLQAAIEIKTNLGGRGDRMTEYVVSDLGKLEAVRQAQPGFTVDLYFLYILRWPTRDSEARRRESGRVARIANLCESRGVEFGTNKPETWFPEVPAPRT